MKKLLSLPANLVGYFHKLQNADRQEWFCTSDPTDHKLGSGGGTSWLLEKCRGNDAPHKPFKDWLKQEKRILLHAGGQSRRLPGYAPSGKILTPIPVFRWATGQCFDQNLLSLQLPLYEKMMEIAPQGLHTLIASGDVYIRNNEPLQEIPQADVICYGLWTDPSIATNHGVFIASRENPDVLDYMLQKPSVEELGQLMATHLFLMDIGIWILSDKAVELLIKRSHSSSNKEFRYYDLYSDFGLTLGMHPKINDPELNTLSVAILPLPGGEFYHYGTSRELISSTLAVQNRVHDQRMIVQRHVKPHPAMFVQNAEIEIPLTADNSNLWIENSHLGKGWKIHNQHLFTGIPRNEWTIEIPAGVCIDIVPIGEKAYAIRPYGFNDAFKGPLDHPSTLFMGHPFKQWLETRNLSWPTSLLNPDTDIQSAAIFPVSHSIEEAEEILKWMIHTPGSDTGKALWLKSRRLSADTISAQANLIRLFGQRKEFQIKNWSFLAKNYEKSVFYQLNLMDAAQKFVTNHIDLPHPLPSGCNRMTRIRDHMFRAKVLQLSGKEFLPEENKAFALLREGLIESVHSQKLSPGRSVYADQIVWSRSPVRIDLAGGWTDTPPYCLNEGGRVVNIAIELNGQPPIQVYIKPNPANRIILRSIDLGAMEVITTYEELHHFTKVGSPFSIPKAALVLSGFSPDFSDIRYSSLEEQLQTIGGGLEITLLSAIPAGSGLGTSSVLAATILGALSDFCGMGWDKNEICRRTLILEQLLTTGGGWQDQFGGVLQGIKCIETQQGFEQSPSVKWLPDMLFTEPEYKSCHLLYYTGITRTAKNILAEIVKGMFLNETKHLHLLKEMKEHAADLSDAIQKGCFPTLGTLVKKTWTQNKALDRGTNPEAIEALIRQIDDYALGYKLPGAGGGGYLYMIAKDPEAAVKIKRTLTQNPPNKLARFVEMTLSKKGLQISRS
ncbi:bifunctional fucokinase/fucose-1-phosphate guanylyltransferase [Culturomica massiliensis]|uniref:bifunctional fucokinase/fucose-1-phosphate guanylyltransferase n=1 Tax=Culturomica massiliensis TaxID=1841857 RepID=UPI002666D519|nr:bifunctional fucokinase/fucose-1-phosphate guanylyltransferase [Culturomica massiliensis]